MRVEASPFAGWSLQEVMAQSSGAATNDIGGKLFYHIRRHLSLFHGRINSAPTAFRFLHLDATELSSHLDSEHFDRIEVSNISDMQHLGTPKTIECVGSLLQFHSVNPHATLIMLFMSAVEWVQQQFQIWSAKDGLSRPAHIARALLFGIDYTAEERQLNYYLPNSHIPAWALDPWSGYGHLLLKFFRDLDNAFDL
jgi:hypothetical protein